MYRFYSIMIQYMKHLKHYIILLVDPLCNISATITVDYKSNVWVIIFYQSRLDYK